MDVNKIVESLKNIKKYEYTKQSLGRIDFGQIDKTKKAVQVIVAKDLNSLKHLKSIEKKYFSRYFAIFMVVSSHNIPAFSNPAPPFEKGNLDKYI